MDTAQHSSFLFFLFFFWFVILIIHWSVDLSYQGFLHSVAEATTCATSYTHRTHLCGSVSSSDVGQSVVLCGWLQFLRQDQFLILRDWNGTVQLVVTDDQVLFLFFDLPYLSFCLFYLFAVFIISSHLEKN